MMSAPSAASRTACDRPCPRAAPVTNATFPSSFPIRRLPLCACRIPRGRCRAGDGGCCLAEGAAYVGSVPGRHRRRAAGRGEGPSRRDAPEGRLAGWVTAVRRTSVPSGSSSKLDDRGAAALRTGNTVVMPIVLLVRHGQASFGGDDYDRLSDLGREQSQATGRWLRHRELRRPVVVHGSLRRQRDTAALAL